MKHEWTAKKGLTGMRCEKCHAVCLAGREDADNCPGYPPPPSTIRVGQWTYKLMND